MVAPTFAARLKMTRQRRGLTLRQLAQLSQVDHAWLNRLETGERSNVSLQPAIRIANALRISLDWLTGRQAWQYDEMTDRGYVIRTESSPYEDVAEAAGRG